MQNFPYCCRLFLIVPKDGLSLHHQEIRKILCGPKSTSIAASVFSNSLFSCCVNGTSFLVHFRGYESLTVKFSISSVEESNKLSVRVFPVSSVVRI